MKRLFLLIFTLVTISAVSAQDDPNGDQTKNKDYDWSWKQNGPVTFTPPPPDPVPIDGGLGFLLAAGGLWGVRNLRKKRKKE